MLANMLTQYAPRTEQYSVSLVDSLTSKGYVGYECQYLPVGICLLLWACDVQRVE